MQKNGKTIFIGHGRSPVWHSLKDFVQDRLGQTVAEFNAEPVAGQNQQARLTCILNDACFAFLIMTGEDKHSDGTLHARENVIHEIGLFQGRLKFEKAIVLLEDGCTEFSNIKGLNHIPFPKDRIEAAFERIRGVLEREGILKTSPVHDFRPKQPMGRLRLAMSRESVVRKQSLRQAILARRNRITKTGNQYD
ncbi:MAG: TIR domain-containing protein [Verrucomicrobiota bacterium]